MWWLKFFCCDSIICLLSRLGKAALFVTAVTFWYWLFSELQIAINDLSLMNLQPCVSFTSSLTYVASSFMLKCQKIPGAILILQAQLSINQPDSKLSQPFAASL